MAQGKVNINVSVENCIHDELRTALQKIAEDHGLRVLDVIVDWSDLSSPGEEKFLVSGLEIRTATR